MLALIEVIVLVFQASDRQSNTSSYLDHPAFPSLSHYLSLSLSLCPALQLLFTTRVFFSLISHLGCLSARPQVAQVLTMPEHLWGKDWMVAEPNGQHGGGSNNSGEAIDEPNWNAHNHPTS